MKTIKVPKPRQLPSGNWFVRIMVSGKSYPITEQTEELCIARAIGIKEELLEAVSRAEKPSLFVAIDRYIEVRSNVLSPATIRGYRTIQKNRFSSAMMRPVNALTEADWQRMVNTEAKLVSAKTLQNAWRFIASVIREETGQRYSIRLPQVIDNRRPFLDPEQIPIFVEAVKSTKYAIPALLALCSLRRSEILALTWDKVDVEKAVVHVSGAVVPDQDNQYIKKAETKNRSSKRTVPIMIPTLLDLLRNAPKDTPEVVTLHPSAILNGINRICKNASLPQVGIHGLRHSFASLAFHLNMPEKIAMQIGGWGDDDTMKKIYTHISQQDILKYKNAMESFYVSL